jgi:maltooligosyltrehalose trehalohydrolase
MTALENGYFGAKAAGVRPGTRYGFRLDGGPTLPDPASRDQPDGVQGLSAIVAPERFGWTDARWRGIPLEQLTFYELHVGTFSRAGTFEGVERQLPYLAELGVSAIELLPVAPFPGRRNWGYDGVYPFAVQHSYGGIAGLQRLSNAAHVQGIALFVDVVYNHLGPEGNHLARFGPYFTDRYRTPWGPALNFDGGGSDEVRRFFLESATSLTAAAHLDGLRVDAVHAIVDPTAQPFLADLTRAVHASARRSGRPCWVVAESSLNDPRVVRPTSEGGLGFDASWNDDFHHALHAVLTGEREGYFVDFGGVDDLRRVLVEGFALAGRYSSFRGRRHGAPAGDLAARRFVVCAQNHDQVGNRPFGERLSRLVPFEAQKLAAGITLLAPFLPLVFMGSEYGETAPFQYFTDHAGRRLARAVRAGRRAEFAVAAGARDPPDPQSPATFARSRIDARRRRFGAHRALFEFHRTLFALRRAFVPVRRLTARQVGQDPADRTILWIHRGPGAGVPPSLAVFRFGPGDGPVVPPPVSQRLELRLASAARRWGGAGARAPAELRPGRPSAVPLPPWSFVLYAGRGRG